MCTKCQNYFCKDCAYYHNNLTKTQPHTCPGHFKEVSESHSPVLVKITKNMTGPDLKGVSMKELEKLPKSSISSSLKILEEPKLPDKPTMRIIGDNEDQNPRYTRSSKDESKKRKKPVILDDD
ncbi:MAG: hypothetical protein ACW967_01615 [Candidatus Hodarchaeales archaeon]